MMGKLAVWFEEVDKNSVDIVGGKGANLGEMLNSRFPIPYGFIVTSKAYFDFIDKNELAPKIKSLLSPINVEQPEQLSSAGSSIRQLILEAEVPPNIIKVVTEYYHRLLVKESEVYKSGSKSNLVKKHLENAYDPPLVAVRSSATAEDLPTASFAGQQETYLNVKGENNLVKKVRECWASLFTDRAIYYRENKGFDHFQVGLAAVIQKMIQSDKSGIAFSIDPVTNDKSVITIEAIYGLGEYIVQGKQTPDHYEVDKKTFAIKKKEIKTQTAKFIKRGATNVEVKISEKEGKKQKLSDEEIIQMAKLVKRIEHHYYFPQDIEWAVEDGQLYIVQSRPITTAGEKKDGKAEDKKQLDLKDKKILLKGDPASPGIRSGPPVIIKTPKEIDKVKKGDILVAPQTNPDFVPAMKRASAIVTETGGRTSHAAIVSRELGIPAVVGAQEATSKLKGEEFVTVNGATGEIYQGVVKFRQKPKPPKPAKHLTTLTKVYVNLANPTQAEKVAKMDIDGVGLLRAEFMIADIGIHPKLFLKEGKQQEFINKLSSKLMIFVKAFSPRPVVYRATDFKTNEYKHLKGGDEFEPEEENPMLGYRGASRYITNKDVFKMELKALSRVRSQGYKNIHLMIPFLRNTEELKKIKKILAGMKLANLPSFKLWIMVEVPSTAILLEEFIKVGIDGVSVGTNDLTMLLLGVDRDNQEISHLYNEMDPAVLWALKRIVTICKKYRVTSSVCGQAPSDYPDLLDMLIRWGITSVSLNPDAVGRAKVAIHKLEKELWQQLRK